MSTTAALLAISLSFVMGVAYVSLGLAPQLRSAEQNDRVTYPHYYELAAAPIFVISQGISALLLWRGDPMFLCWILPPSTYLFLIGLLCWFRFGRRDMLVLDTGRGVLLLAASLLAWSRLISGDAA